MRSSKTAVTRPSALPHVRTGLHPIGHLVRRHHQRHQAARRGRACRPCRGCRAGTARASACGARIRARAVAVALVGERVAEGIAQRLGGVFERLELLHHRQRVQRRRRARLDLGDPLLEVGRLARRAGDAARAAGEHQATRTSAPAHARAGAVMRMVSPRISGSPLLGGGVGRCLLFGHFFFVEVTVGLDRAGQFERAVRA